jgi:hypothetical protein
MKAALERPELLVVMLTRLSIRAIVSFGLGTRKGRVLHLVDLAHLISTLAELPCNVVTSLRTFPERMDPTCSECR